MSINLSHLKKLIATMIPILIAQVSTVGMNFMDSTMSGHVSANDLAGVSIGASLFLPIQTTAMGLLTAATPMAAQLMGKKEKESIPMIIRTGLYLALLLSFLFALLYYLLIDTVLEGLSLAPAVSSIAKDYMLALVGAFLFEMLAMPLRSLTDTVGATTISMRLFLLALPVNGLLNYAFIFGKWGAPALGGVGAGIATLLTYVFLVLLFLAVILSHKPFMGRALFSSPESRLFVWKEYMALGIPNALGVFMETSLFGFIIVFITKFGTETIAAHQAALNFSGIIYMIPMSCSMAMTILVGYEVGARRYDLAREYSRLGLLTTLTGAAITISATLFFRKEIISLYSTDPAVIALGSLFLVYCAGWQLFDDIAAPIQGILRGYKDAKVPFFLMLIAYWFVCFPSGLFFDYVLSHGPESYWQCIDLGVGTSALLLMGRLWWIERKVTRD